jgi:hypothetical protein
MALHDVFVAEEKHAWEEEEEEEEEWKAVVAVVVFKASHKRSRQMKRSCTISTAEVTSCSLSNPSPKAE